MIISIILFTFFYISGCDSPLNSGEDLVCTSQDCVEAQKIALWYAAKLQAPAPVIEQQLQQIKQLRSMYGTSIPAVNSRFKLPWVERELAVKFTKEAATAINEGRFDWSLLEPVATPDTILKYPNKLGWALLGFDENLHPWRLSVRYNELPGVIVSEPNLFNFGGFGEFPLKLHPIENGLGYLFTSGSTLGPYHYFTYTQGRIKYIGSWDRQNEDPPDWWLEIRTSIRNFACRGAPEQALCWNTN